MIKLIKLVTGEDVIAEVTEHGDRVYLKNAIRLAVTNQGVAMMPFSPFIKEDMFNIHTNHIIFQAEVDDEVRNAYNSKFGSGIIVAPSGMIQ